MQRTDYEVIVVGAGLVGLALAVALARAGLAVAIVDRAALAPAANPASSEDWDARVYAISPGSVTLLHALGVWQQIPAERIAAIEAMEVFGDGDGELGFSAYELGERALAWIVENRELNAALTATARITPGIELFAPCAINNLSWSANAAQLQLTDGRTLSAQLVVGADGLHSWTRELAGIRARPRAYDQTALVANFTTERAHRGRAFQWFMNDGGVLAWLPLPGKRISIVWSAPKSLAVELLAHDGVALAERVAAAGRMTLGALNPITPATTFPLAFLRLAESIGHRVALVGDAAHSVHPLAGQGVNLGFADAGALASVLAARGAVKDAGAAIVLERYARMRAEPVLAMQVVTDALVKLFGTPSPVVRGWRNRGMRIVDALKPLKRLLAQPALR